MSRSTKKNPIYTDGRNGRKISKRFANKTVRQYKGEIAKGKSYKKLYNSYDIHDFTNRYSWEEAILDYYNNEYGYLQTRFPSLSAYYRCWRKYYKNK